MISVHTGLRRAAALAATLAVVVASVAVFSAAVVAEPAYATATRPTVEPQTRTLTVNPSTGLVDGQYVSLTLTGGALGPFGLALCETGASPAAQGECGSATVNGFFSYVVPGEQVVTGSSAHAPAGIAPGERRAFSGAQPPLATAPAEPTQPPPTIQVVISLDAAFRDPAGALVDCRAQPRSSCDLVITSYDVTGQVDGPRARVTFDPNTPLRPPLTMTVTPATGLHDGQNVNLAFQHVKSGGVTAVECIGTTTAADDAVTECGDEDGVVCPVAATGPGALPISCLPYNGFGSGVQVYAQADAQGNAWARLAVRALLETAQGLVDCRTRTGAAACILQTGDQLTGPITQHLTFDPNAPLNLPGPVVYFRPGSQPRPSNRWTQTLDLAGFTPGTTVTFTWCNSTVCAGPAITNGIVQVNGTTEGIALPDPPPAPSTSLDCAPTNPCHVRLDDGHGISTSLPNVTNTGQPPNGVIESENLPISITPDTNLTDAQQVMVSGQGFPPNTSLAMVECTQDVATHGISACDLSTSTFGGGTNSDSNGVLASTPFTVRKTITIAGEKVDCAAGNVDPVEFRLHDLAGDPRGVLGQAGYTTCIVGVASLEDNYVHSGFGAIAFTGENFTPFPGDATPHELSAEPLIPPCDRVAGVPRFVRLLVLRFAGRCPSPQELAWWDTSSRSGTSDSAVALQIALSNDSLRAIVEGIYQAVLGRSADPVGLAYWTSVLATSQRRDQVTGDLLTSPELTARYPTTQAWVVAVYEKILGRQADRSEIAYWDGLISGGWSRQQVALSIIDSRESGVLQIDRAYRKVLHRPAGTAETDHWLSVLNPNAQTFTLESALASSAEFTTAAQSLPTS